MKLLFSVLSVALACLCLSPMGHAETPSILAETNAQESLRAYLQVQEQLHANQLAIEAARKEADEAAARNAAALAKNAEDLASRLKSIEEALTIQRREDLKAIQSSSRMMLLLSGGFAVLGISAILLMAFLQWRTVNRLAEMSGSHPGWRSLGPGPEVKVLGAGGNGISPPVREVNMQLADALEQLEKRMLGLEERSKSSMESRLADASPVADPSGRPSASSLKPASEAELIARGQALLDKDRPAEALAVFDQVIGGDPQNADAYVRKGSALEKLGRFDESIQCFDRALQIDGSLTIAFLHKGGVLNRMERFAEALDCYEKALRTQEKQIA